MRPLTNVAPTPEQLPLIQDARPGVVLIRGAAGSGKTTIALLRLRQLVGFWLRRREREEIESPVRVLVITYNRTLRGYIADLARQQIVGRANLDFDIQTFAKWAMTLLPVNDILRDSTREERLRELGRNLPLAADLLFEEVDYVLGRFPEVRLNDYLTCRRDGRGATPRVDRALRQRILDEVVVPYQAWKREIRQVDWNDLAVQVAGIPNPNRYDVIIADEVQDLSANQVRALTHFAKDSASITFVLDAAQRIYPRGFTWGEVGITVSPNGSHRLSRNYRNTVEICRFASPLIEGLDIGDDGTFPNFESCQSHGDLPLVIKGKYSQQVAYALRYIEEHVNLPQHSVAFLHPKGGGWFGYLKSHLQARSFSFVEITRKSEWPPGDENIALSTMHSAKGLEFDYVLILGLSNEITMSGSEPDHTQLDEDRRLLAMAITRARKGVIIGYKPTEASHLITYFRQGTFTELEV